MKTLLKKQIILLIFFIASIYLQKAYAVFSNKGVEQIKYDKNSTYPSLVKFNSSDVIPFNRVIPWIKTNYNMPVTDELQLLKTEADRLGYTHYRYQQTFEGIPVEDAIYIIHTNNDKVASMTGHIFSKINISTIPVLTEQQALEKALNYVGATEYKWQKNNNFKLPKAEIVVAAKNGKYTEGEFYLTYKFDIYAVKPLKRAYIFVDAQTGQIVYDKNRIFYDNSVGTAHTRYSGIQQIITDSINPTFYRLRENSRGLGQGVETYYSETGDDFTDEDNIWNTTTNFDNAAYDAHWGAEATYDFYLNKFGRNSYDDNGSPIISYVHDAVGVNAYWDGSAMNFGDGDGVDYFPLTCLDIVGHEFTHGLTQQTAGLIYEDESGALNESFSDILGTAIEFYKKPGTANFFMGEQMGTAFRSMMNPNVYGDPDTYFGTYWYTGTEDNGGVHRNSGVQNFWFYLLSQGGTGTNDLGDPYAVNGIGMDKAVQIAYRTLTVYLTPYSGYEDAALYSRIAAADLYGACSPEVLAVMNAWYATGVLFTPPSTNTDANFGANDSLSCMAPFTVTFINSSSSATNYLWDFGDGITSTDFSPVHTYTATGSYTVTLIAYGCIATNDTVVKNNFIRIDSSLPCAVSMPLVGSLTVTPCEGTAYDTGGKNSPYHNNTNSVLTIAPPGASNIVLDFGSWMNFDFLENDVLYIYDGPDINSPLIGAYSQWDFPGYGMPIVSSTGSVTLQQITDASDVASGFKMQWKCKNTPSPVPLFTTEFYSYCGGLINFLDESLLTPTSWHWDFGDGGAFSTDQNPVHTFTSSDTYTITLVACNAYGCDSISKSMEVTVNPVLCGNLSIPNYDFVAITGLCNGKIYDSGGSNTNYKPNNYGSITIQPDGTSQIKLTFTNFNYNASADSLYIYEGNNYWDSNNLIGVFTGTVLPNDGMPIISSGNAMTILEKTPSGITKSGFKVNWECYPPATTSVKDNDITDEQFNLFPNPANDIVNITYQYNRDKNFIISITSILGQEIYKEQVNNHSGNYSKSFDFSGYAKGIYQVTLMNDDNRIVKKLVVN